MSRPSDKDKTEARDALEIALTLNEPEIMLEGLRRLCAKKADDEHLGDNERARYRSAHEALERVSTELEHVNAPAKRDNDGESAPAAQSSVS